MTHDEFQLDQLADEFEAAWRTGPRPVLALFLQRIDPGLQVRLAELLIPIDAEYRTKKREQIRREDYVGLGQFIEPIVDRLLRGQLGIPLREKSLADVDRTVDSKAIPISPADDATLDSGAVPSSKEELELSTRAATDHATSKSRTIGNYKLLQKLGEGGMGTVWMAEQEKPVRRRVALKVIKAGLDNKKVIARFEAERQAVAIMNHENICKILDAGTTDAGQPYFVMELVQGIPFNKYCDDNKLSIKERLELFIPICNAVQHAHQKGIIHRDLKPTNVLVCLYDGKPVPKIIDFGLAKALQHQTKLTDKTMFTEFGQVVGTLQYMSPEQAEMNQLDIDTRTDIYSLGVMLYELLTGSTPIDADTMKGAAIFKILETIREKEPPRPSARLSSNTNEAVTGISAQRQIDSNKLKNILRGDLDWIVMKSIEKNRSRRYETANGFADDIENYLTGEVVAARPPSTSYRVGKYIRKNKGLVASLATIATLLIAGIIGTSWFAVDASIARKKADESTAEVVVEKKNVEIQRDRANENESKTKDALEKTEATLARSNFFLASARWDANRVEEANKYLDLIPQKYRNIEWYVFHNQFAGGYMTLSGHTGSVNSISFAPDGKRIVSASSDGTLRLWNAINGEELATLSRLNDGASRVCFSPDGTQIAAGRGDGRLNISDGFDLKQIRTLIGHKGQVNDVNFSPDGTRILSGSSNTVKLWEAFNGTELNSMTGRDHTIWRATFSPLGESIVTCQLDETIWWDAVTGEKIKSLKNGGTSFCFSPDGRRIAYGNYQTLSLWDASTNNKLWSRLAHSDSIKDIRFSPDGTLLATASADLMVKVWEVSTSDELLELKSHTGPVNCLCFSPDGQRIASGGFDSMIKVWNLDSQTSRQVVNDVPSVLVEYFENGRRKRTFSSSFEGLNSPFWDRILKPKVANSEQRLELNGVIGLSWTEDAKQIVSAGGTQEGKGSLLLRDPFTGETLREFNGHTAPILSVACSSKKLLIATGSWDKSIKIWNINQTQELKTLKGHNYPVKSVSFSADGSSLVSGSFGGDIKLWEVDSGNEFWSVEGNWNDAFHVAFRSDNLQIVTAHEDGTVNFIDVKTGDLVRTIPKIGGRVSSFCLSRDGSKMAMGNAENLSLWEVDTGRKLRSFEGHKNCAISIEFSSDGKRILSADASNILKLWDAETGVELATLRGKPGFGVAKFSPDGTCIVAGNEDGSLKLWGVSSMDEVRKFQSSDGNKKNSPRENAWRAANAKINASWHLQRAKKASQEQNWFAATIHRAWLMKFNPELGSSFDNLHHSFGELKKEYENRERDLNEFVPIVVREMLALPRGNVITTEDPISDLLEYNNSIWKQVASPIPLADLALLRDELNEFRELLQKYPYPEGIYLNTLGTAEFRMGDFHAAIDACAKSLELTSKEMNLPGPHPIDFAVIAMSHFKLGQLEKANEFRKQFDDTMKLESFKDDQECQSFASEVEQLFASEATELQDK